MNRIVISWLVLDIELIETNKDKMVINESKCNVITFNFSKYNTCPQSLTLNGNLLKSCNKITLLGVIITEDLKWKENTANICKKVNKKFYIIWKLKQFGLKEEELLTAWKVMLRPIAEYTVPLWHSGLTDMDSDKLETLQKRALGLILGTIYQNYRRYYKINGEAVSYENALIHCNLTSLNDRRRKLTDKFAIDTAINRRHKNFFEDKINTGPQTRSKPVVKEKYCETNRYFNSAIPYMSRTLNNVKGLKI